MAGEMVGDIQWGTAQENSAGQDIPETFSKTKDGNRNHRFRVRRMCLVGHAIGRLRVAFSRGNRAAGWTWFLQLAFQVGCRAAQAAFKYDLKEHVVWHQHGFARRTFQRGENHTKIDDLSADICRRQFNLVANVEWFQNYQDESAEEVAQNTPHGHETNGHQAKHGANHGYQTIDLKPPSSQDEERGPDQDGTAQYNPHRGERQARQFCPVRELQNPALEAKEEAEGDGGNESRLQDSGDGFWIERFKHGDQDGAMGSCPAVRRTMDPGTELLRFHQ